MIVCEWYVWMFSVNVKKGVKGSVNRTDENKLCGKVWENKQKKCEWVGGIYEITSKRRSSALQAHNTRIKSDGQPRKSRCVWLVQSRKGEKNYEKL